MACGAVEKLYKEFVNMEISQAKPLSAGETLGCTAPILPGDSTALIFIADGRFHLEAAMIQNPKIPAFRYDPYSKVMTQESYDVETMKSIRLQSIEVARRSKVFGLILGTLGRQGSPGIFTRMRKLLSEKGKVVIPFLMAEINPVKIASISQVEVWVQVACPRLSIDWSGGFAKPVLTPYELEVALGSTEWKETYPMDYYAAAGGSWTNMSNR